MGRTKQAEELRWDGAVGKRCKDGTILFEDHAEFRPNLTPAQVLSRGSFGGSYFRDLHSGVTGKQHKDTWKELPKEWLKGLDIKTQVASGTYRESINKFKVNCGAKLDKSDEFGLGYWESKGWIVEQDPYGWFHWYCRFFQGRRSPDDARQISRWNKCAGPKGRWRNNLINKVLCSGKSFDDPTVSPVVRQTLQHWAYELTEADVNKHRKKLAGKHTVKTEQDKEESSSESNQKRKREQQKNDRDARLKRRNRATETRTIKEER